MPKLTQESTFFKEEKNLNILFFIPTFLHKVILYSLKLIWLCFFSGKCFFDPKLGRKSPSWSKNQYFQLFQNKSWSTVINVLLVVIGYLALVDKTYVFSPIKNCPRISLCKVFHWFIMMSSTI